MSHQHRHRGAHPEDESLFSDSLIPMLRSALRDFCWLLSRGYAIASSLKLVGDKFRLTDRQRLLLMRSACTDSQRQSRQQSQLEPAAIAGEDVYLDGFNVLITIESALSNGFLFIGQDGCYRDLSSVHGTYKRVQETQAAITVIGQTLQELQVAKAFWLLDKPVSNSGELRKRLLENAATHGWNWNVDLHQSPDYELKKVDAVTVSTDSVILDSVSNWFHLNLHVIQTHVPDARLVELRDLKH